MEVIPLHRVAVVRSFTDFLDAVGAPIERGFRRAGLPICSLEDDNNFVPSHRFWSFLIDMAFSQGMPDLGSHVGQKFGANSVDSHLIDLLRRTPTLYRGLVSASDLINRTITNCQVGVLQPTGSQYTYLYHSPSCEAHNSAIEQIGWFGVETLIGMVRAFTGPEWQPSEIGVMVNHHPSQSIREKFGGTRIRLAQPYSYIALENSLLSLPPFDDKAAVPRDPPQPYGILSLDFAGSFKQLLLAYVQDTNLRIERAAELCDMSKRTLQRRLAAQGTHYSRVLDEARFEVAKRLLQDRDKNVNDISKLLGYSDPTHFSRAFRRIAGVTPRIYRQSSTGIDRTQPARLL